ncbi:MAG: nuclear protein [Segetibacter sp.]|nr:nuclear protein [Segetibacter sp.]
MALLEKQLEIKESHIPGAGKGLFTTEFIPKGERIVEYKGRVRTWKDAQHDDTNYYILFVTRNHIIDAQKFLKSPARYINDARGLKKIKGINNNAAFYRYGKKIFVEAIKDIPAGSEIYVGYGKEYWDVIRANLKVDAKNSKA